jgi:hypothetical protein
LSVAPSAELGPRPPDDKVLDGCLFGCACQAAFCFLGFLAAFANSGKLSNFLFVSWGVTQWIAIGPLIWQQKSQGYPNRVKGLIVTGCIGVLLSSACGLLSFR